MRSKAGRVLLGVAVIVAAVGLLLILKSNDEGGGGGSAVGENVKSGVPTIVVKHGKPVGGVLELTYRAGEDVRFKVESDVADEIHVHGYEIARPVAAGGTASFDFPARIEGIFEAELEHRAEQILELRVNP